MYKIFLPFLLICLWSRPALSQAGNSQSWSYGIISFPDGTSKEYYMYYNTFKDWLYFEDEDQEGKLNHFDATDVVSFDYQGKMFYSLPFSNGSLSFFKVEFEGRKTALLSKPVSVDLLNYLVRRYEKEYTLCGKYFQLCEVRYQYGNINHPHNAGPLLSREVTPVKLSGCLFTVGEQGLKLYQIDLEKEVLFGLLTTKQKRKVKTLEEIFGREDFREVRQYATRNKLKEKKLGDLITLIRYYDDQD